MRPRLLHLGYQMVRIYPSYLMHASMRPRLLHLGYFALGDGRRIRVHGFNEAEAFTPRILEKKETLAPKTNPSFNEAEAFTPRIRRIETDAQTGHGGFNEAEAFTPRIQSATRGCFSIYSELQ